MSVSESVSQTVTEKLVSLISSIMYMYNLAMYSCFQGRPFLSVLDKKSMPYTCATILEIQRLGDIAPFSLPHSNAEPVLVDSYLIPAASLIIPNVNSVHYNEDIWENPLDFRPARFLNSEGTLLNYRKKFMPFFIGQFIIF